jgi:hypothetical protein
MSRGQNWLFRPASFNEALVGKQALVDLVRDTPPQQSESLGLAVSDGHSSLDVCLTGPNAAPLGNRDSMQRGVDLAIAAAVRTPGG